MNYNVINPEDAELFLYFRATEVDALKSETELLKKHLRTALLKPLLSDLRFLTKLREYPRNGPAWLTQDKFDNNNFYLFSTNGDKFDWRIWNDVNHIRDWIFGAIKEKDTWVKNVDDEGRPKKLLQISTIDDAKNRADKEMARKANILRSKFLGATNFEQDESDGHLKTVYRFEDGYRLVELLTPHALDVESAHMQHCIGQGAYDQRLTSSNGKRYYSLRSPDNNPHGTFETWGNAVMQCVGKQNAPISNKYLKYVKKVMDDPIMDWHIHVVDGQMGYVSKGDIIYSANEMPDDFTHRGNLIIGENKWLKSLPKNLTIVGDLHLDDCANFRRVSEGLVVTGTIYFNDKSKLISKEFEDVEEFRSFMLCNYSAAPINNPRRVQENRL